MPTLLGPAIDPTLASPPAIISEASGTLREPLPVPPVDDGDPDVEYVPVIPAKRGLRVQVVVSTAIRRDVIGELVTAEVEDWDEDVELLVGTSASISISSWDPLLAVLAERSWVGSDGRTKYEWSEAKRYLVTIYVDGSAVETFLFRRPIDVGGDRMVLPCVGQSEIISERFIGRVEQVDLLDNWGDFEHVPLGEEPPGLIKVPAGDWPMTAIVVADGVRGTKCLQVTGPGWVFSPKVPLPGQPGVGRTAEGAAFGKFPSNIPNGKAVVRTYTQRADSLLRTNFEATVEKAGGRPDSSTRWSAEPVTSGAVMSPSSIIHWTWVALRGFTDPTRYDLVTLRQGILTGYLTDQDLARYPVRILRDLNALSLGGSPTGLTSRIMGLTGVEDQMTWAHNSNPPASEAFRAVLESEGAPECRITPAGVLEVWPRLGADREDVAITMDNVLDPAWAFDPGNQVDDFIVDTGRGSGTSKVTVTVHQPFDSDVHRISRVVPAPRNMGLNALGRWGQRHARTAAIVQATAELPMPWHEAKRLHRGDTVWVSIHDGDAGLDRRMRVLNLRWQPASMTATVKFGAVDG